MTETRNDYPDCGLTARQQMDVDYDLVKAITHCNVSVCSVRGLQSLQRLGGAIVHTGITDGYCVGRKEIIPASRIPDDAE